MLFRSYLVEGNISKKCFAAKEIDVSLMSADAQFDTLKEAKIMKELNHPNIIKYYEAYKTRKGNLCIVMEYADSFLFITNRW